LDQKNKMEKIAKKNHPTKKKTKKKKKKKKKRQKKNTPKKKHKKKKTKQKKEKAQNEKKAKKKKPHPKQKKEKKKKKTGRNSILRGFLRGLELAEVFERGFARRQPHGQSSGGWYVSEGKKGISITRKKINRKGGGNSV